MKPGKAAKSYVTALHLPAQENESPLHQAVRVLSALDNNETLHKQLTSAVACIGEGEEGLIFSEAAHLK